MVQKCKKREEQAVELVKLYEEKRGYKAWKPKKKIGCDLVSSGGCYIEVKSWNKTTPPKTIDIYETIFEHLKKIKKNESAYYIYIVYDFTNGPKLLRIPPKKQEWYKHKKRILKVPNIKPIKLPPPRKKLS